MPKDCAKKAADARELLRLKNKEEAELKAKAGCALADFYGHYSSRDLQLEHRRDIRMAARCL